MPDWAQHLHLHSRLGFAAGIGLSLLVGAQTPAGWKELKIGPATGQNTRISPAGIESQIISLRGIIAVAHGLPHPDHRITGPAILDSERMAVRAIPEEEGLDNLRGLLRKLLDDRFGFKAHREQQPRLVLVLKQVTNRPGKLQAHTGEPSNLRVGHGTLEGSGPISALLPHIEFRVDRPVVDESGLQGTYRFQLTWEAGNRQSFLNSLEEQLGLVLSHEERSIEVLVVDKVEAYRVAP
ncbi:MAG: TIGR03435 family protein, partial [Bryobacteraceae bacterium]